MRDDLLRQGAPGRGLQRHLLLVAEPPRGHGVERQFLRPSFSARLVAGVPWGAGPVLVGFARSLGFRSSPCDSCLRCSVFEVGTGSETKRVETRDKVVVPIQPEPIASGRLSQSHFWRTPSFKVIRFGHTSISSAGSECHPDFIKLRMPRRCSRRWCCARRRLRRPTMSTRKSESSSSKTSCGNSPGRTRNCNTVTGSSKSA